MNLLVKAGVLTVSLSVLVEAGYEYRRRRRSEGCVNEGCVKLADAFEEYLSTSMCVVPSCCESSKVVYSTILGKDVTSRETVEELACIITDNSASGTALYSALDSAGYIDRLVEIFYAIFAGVGTEYTMQLREMTLEMELLGSCPQHFGHSKLAGLAHFGGENLRRLLNAIEELQLWSLSREETINIGAALRLTEVFGRNVGSLHIPRYSPSLAVSDPEERCKILTEAAEPFMAIAAPDIERFITEMREYMGVNLTSNFAEKMLCDIAKADGVDDYKDMLEESGLLQGIFEVLLGSLCPWMQDEVEYREWEIENQREHGLTPSEESVAKSEAARNLVAMWQEIGMGSIQLDLPEMAFLMMGLNCEAPQPNPIK